MIGLCGTLRVTSRTVRVEALSCVPVRGDERNGNDYTCVILRYFFSGASKLTTQTIFLAKRCRMFYYLPNNRGYICFIISCEILWTNGGTPLVVG
mmetsp:Transcript_10810/g.25065  ORF Transcript_10810/g.25065 Transcript_10810/m.25065 type:complete len:95 (+) Transcript_10810:50-334(+)